MLQLHYSGGVPGNVTQRSLSQVVLAVSSGLLSFVHPVGMTIGKIHGKFLLRHLPIRIVNHQFTGYSQRGYLLLGLQLLLLHVGILQGVLSLDASLTLLGLAVHEPRLSRQERRLRCD